jgi:hypothetical protein
MQMMFDGGSVYTLGNQPGSALTRNHIYEQQHYFKGSALYHDQGSGGWLDKENVVHSLAGPRHGAGNSPSSGCFHSMPWITMWNAGIHDSEATVLPFSLPVLVIFSVLPAAQPF